MYLCVSEYRNHIIYSGQWFIMVIIKVSLTNYMVTGENIHILQSAILLRNDTTFYDSLTWMYGKDMASIEYNTT